MNDYALVADLVLHITEQQYEATLRLVNRQPDAALLRRMLGLETSEAR